ncbi:LysR family transcriptional regulator [Pseudomonas sp. UL073]|uniref:LysR family transcriptional regulator n=1 Tax=Zestomonas insulae TaxID=2809017 RepID=A0ABS2I7H3_9GAMM|nr:LysR family transcriptional regulator [Pseudomonas insulae]MBM7059089.1 LysR family transcriptional regulator [Pseudomonas insulae]
MDLLQGMRVFARVVDCDGFTAAAQTLDLSAAQVSRLISDLETQLQARLLHRTTRRLRLTEAGERFLLRCRQILEQTDEAIAEARGAHLTPSGRLRVHSMHALGVLLTPLIASYNQRFPDVVFELSLSQRNPDPLEEGHDVVIAVGETLPDSQLVAQPIGRLYSVLCAAPGYLAERGVPQHPAELDQHRCLRMVEPLYEEAWLFHDAHGEHCVQPGQTFLTNVAESMVKAAEAGMGVCLLPFYTASGPLAAGSLQRVLPDYRLRERAIHAIYPSRHYLDAKVRTWIDFLRDELPALFAEHEQVLADPRHWAQ